MLGYFIIKAPVFNKKYLERKIDPLKDGDGKIEDNGL